MGHHLPDYATLRAKVVIIRNSIDLLWRDFDPVVDRVRSAKVRKSRAGEESEVFRAIAFVATELDAAYKAARDAVQLLDFLERGPAK